MVRIRILTSALHLVALPSLSRSMATTSTKAASASVGQSEIAIKAAKDFTISQRKKLQDLGALDIQRPFRITGEPLAVPTTDSTGEESAKTKTITKVIHFQRHGQGFHNLICDIWREQNLPIDFDSTDPALNPVVRDEFLDPPLTETGRVQCKGKREQCAKLTGLELVIVSPLLRCIQTAKLSFQDHLPHHPMNTMEHQNEKDGIDTSTGKKHKNIPWVSHEGCREELGLLTGNKRRPISDIRMDHPFIDFSPITSDEDDLWDHYNNQSPPRRETLLEKSERIYEFLVDFVRLREEKEIAIVCHSAYLFTLLNAVMDIEEEDLRYWFLTSEVRSMVVKFEENPDYVD